MNELIDQFFNIEIMTQAFPYLLKGLWLTILLSFVLVPAGMFVGLLLALGCESRLPAVRILFRAWVGLFRTFPPLVFIILVFSALPFLGIRLSALTAAGVAMVVTSSSYYSEILRAGLVSIAAGQSEAARSTGLSKTQTLVYVVLPQAVRNVFPDLASNSIEVVKFTSLASIIGVHELLHMAGVVRSVTYNTSPLVLASLLYILILLPPVRMIGRMQAQNRTR